MIAAHQGADAILAVRTKQGDPPMNIKLGGYTLNLTFIGRGRVPIAPEPARLGQPPAPRPPAGSPAQAEGAAIFVEASLNEFYMGAVGGAVRITPSHPTPPARPSSGSATCRKDASWMAPGPCTGNWAAMTPARARSWASVQAPSYALPSTVTSDSNAPRRALAAATLPVPRDAGSYNQSMNFKARLGLGALLVLTFLFLFLLDRTLDQKPAPNTQSTFLRGYDPGPLCAACSASAPAPQTPRNVASAGRYGFATHKLTLDPTIPLAPGKTQDELLTAIHEDARARLTHDGAHLITDHPEIPAGYRIGYTIGASRGAFVVKPTAPVANDTAHLNITIEEMWSEAESHRPAKGHS